MNMVERKGSWFPIFQEDRMDRYRLDSQGFHGLSAFTSVAGDPTESLNHPRILIMVTETNSENSLHLPFYIF